MRFAGVLGGDTGAQIIFRKTPNFLFQKNLCAGVRPYGPRQCLFILSASQNYLFVEILFAFVENWPFCRKRLL